MSTVLEQASEVQNYYTHYRAEDCVIAAMLTDNSLIEEISATLKAEDFCLSFNELVYKTILEMVRLNELPVDLFTLANKLVSDDAKEGEMVSRVGVILQASFALGNVGHYVEIVKEKAKKRRLSQLLVKTQQGSEDKTAEEMLFDLQKGMQEVSSQASFEVLPYASVLESTLLNLQKECNRKQALTGLSTGFKDLDQATNGLQRGDLIILAARPSMGKTMLALNIADNLGCYQKLPVIFFSLEMSKEPLCKRTLSRIAKVEGENLFSGNLSATDWEKLGKLAPYMAQSKVFVNDKSRLSVAEMRAYARRVKSLHGLQAIFVDYIGLVAGEGENETLRVGHISAELKAMAKDFDVPVFVLSQLNRAVEARQDKRPLMADIRQSGSIEQDADLVMFLYRDEQYHPNTHQKNQAELNITKHRNGKTGLITLKYLPEYFEFMDIA